MKNIKLSDKKQRNNECIRYFQQEILFSSDLIKFLGVPQLWLACYHITKSEKGKREGEKELDRKA